MIRLARRLVASVALLVLLTTSALAEDQGAKQLDAKASPVVLVKLVLKIGESEQNFDQVGNVVDASGVVMTQNLPSPRGGAKITPTSIRVVFPGDEKEYDAVLGAFDSKLGLAFVRIKDLAGKSITSIDITQAGECRIGDELFGVTRTDEGFDYAPYYGNSKVVGQVSKPRTMWLVSGFTVIAHPLYTADGKAAGIVIRQEGISEGWRSSRIGLLPMAAAQGVIQQAIKASAKALDECKVQEAAAKEAGAKEGAGEAGSDAAPKTPEPGMAEAPPMGEAPAGMADTK